MTDKIKLFRLLFVLALTGVPFLNSCTREIEIIKQEKEIVFPEDHDDRESRNAIVQYNIFDDNLYLDKIFPMPTNAPDYIKKEIWDKEQKAMDEHKKKFKLFTDIIPREYRREITQLKVFYPEVTGNNALAIMSVRKNSSLNDFTLGLAYDVERGKTKIPSFSAPDYRYNTLGYDMTTYAMIHEFGHYITLNKTQQYLHYLPESDSYGNFFKEGSFIKQMRSISWGKVAALPDEIFMSPNFPSKVFNALPGEFVSAYACSSLEEDGAETFSHFVLLDNKPEEIDGKSKKILLFYKDPEMLKIRNAIRQNLKKMGIVPGTPNM